MCSHTLVSIMDDFDETLSFLKDISVPRYVKTENDKIIGEKIFSEFNRISERMKSKNINSEVKEQGFSTSSLFIEGVLNLIHPISGLLMILSVSLYLNGNFSAALGTTIILSIYSLFSRQIIYFLQFRVAKWGRQYCTSNIIFNVEPELEPEGKLKGKPKEDPKKDLKKDPKNTIVYVAHRDSISHRITPLTEGIAFFVGFLVAFAFSIHMYVVIIPCLKGNCSTVPLKEIAWGLIFGIFTFILLLNQKGDKSIGVLDDATGIATMYYLAKKIEKKPLTNTKVIFLATGAEEFGDIGSFNYIKQYKKDLPKETTKFIIIDSVGTTSANMITYGFGYPVRRFSPELEEISKEINLSMGEPLKYATFPPLLQVATDHVPIQMAGAAGIDLYGVPIHKEGYECLIFHCEDFTLFHGKKDNWDNFNKTKFVEICQFCEKMLRKIDLQL